MSTTSRTDPPGRLSPAHGADYFRVPAWWKRYRGGTAAKLWIDRTDSGEFERLLPDHTASLVHPIFAGDRLLVVSDHLRRRPRPRKVVVTPQDRVAGRDPQLDAAIRLALEQLARQPAATPPEMTAI
ncbi:MAG: hypothetical protein M3P18_01235 [Actinomycetota bacterium]|nr:hypothetical protein [Actinomycetota bacterium]